MRLSQRLRRLQPSATVSITARALEMRAAGRDIVSLSAGEPDFETPEHIKAAAVAALQSGDTKYTAVAGTPKLRAAIAAKLARDNGLEYALDQIVVSSGAKQACFNACLALLEPGDEAVIPAPYWVSYPDMVRLTGAEPVIVPTAAEDGFRMSPEQLDAALNANTRLLFLNSPCNPTGAVYSAEDLKALGEVLATHPQVFVLSDDIYEHIVFGDRAFDTFAHACPDLYERTLTVNGLSKCYAMSGWRIGYAAGPRELIAGMTALQSQSTTNACTISQAAACAALNGDQTFIGEMRDAFEQRHNLVLERLRSIPGIECPPGSGAFYLFPDISGAMDKVGAKDDIEFCERLLESAGLALVPGSAFGARNHLRLSFAASESTLEAAADRLRNFVTQ